MEGLNDEVEYVLFFGLLSTPPPGHLGDIPAGQAPASRGQTLENMMSVVNQSNFHGFFVDLSCAKVLHTV